MELAPFKNRVHSKYKKFGIVPCKVVGENVVFNRYGWVHLSFDGKGHRRKNKNIIMRLSLVLHAPEVVKSATTIIKDEMKYPIIKCVKRKIRLIEIASEVGDGSNHVTVILRKIVNGKLHFYSVRRTKNKIKKLLRKQKSP